MAIDQALALIAFVVVAVALNVWLMRWLRQYLRSDEAEPQVRVLGNYSPILTLLRYRRLSLPDWRAPVQARKRAWNTIVWPALTRASTGWLLGVLCGAAFLAGLIGQYYLVDKHDLVPGLWWLGSGSVLFVLLAQWLMLPDQPPVFSAPISSRPLAQNTWLRLGLITSSIALGGLNVFLINARRGAGSHWGFFGLWIASIVLYLLAFVLRRESRSIIQGNQWRILVLLTPVVLAAFLLRFYALGRIPLIMEGDEGAVGVQAIAVLKGELRNMFQTYGGYGTLHFFLMALFVKLFGTTKFAIRLLSVLGGLLAIPLIARLANRLFGLRVALVAAVLLAVSHFHIHFSRVSPTASSLDPLFATLSLYLVYEGLRTGRLFTWALAGFALAIGLYFYVGARVITIIAAVYITLLMAANRATLRSNLPRVVALAGAYLATAAPMILWAIQDPGGFNARLNSIGIVQSGWLDYQLTALHRPFWGVMIGQIIDSLLIFHYHSARWFYEAAVPMLGPLTGLFFAFGLIYSAVRWRDRRFLLLNVWFWITLVIGQVMMIDPVGSAYRTMALFPAVCIMAAVALVKLATSSMIAWHGNGKRLALLAITLVLSIEGWWNIYYYFADWAPKYLYSDPNTRLASLIGEYLGELKPDDQVYIVDGPSFRGEGWMTIRYLGNNHSFLDLQGELAYSIPPIDLGRNLVFIVTPERLDELRFLREVYPEGRQEGHYLNTTLYFVSYEIPARFPAPK